MVLWGYLGLYLINLLIWEETIIKRITIISILAILLIVILYFYVEGERSIALEEVMQINAVDELSGDWWYFVSESTDEILGRIGINVDGFDFRNNNLIVSNGREIKELYFVRSENLPFRKTHFAEAIFKEELHSHTWFVYKIKKIEVYSDQRYKNGNNRIEK
ncbi:hypothetical protein [Paenibacillus alvei]|uniref:hypothetical protein n=1 Tax=Paenibacillus alvei TaxID=44250 RepID=UPI002280507B|nr:hypothetical protein [Paenibacillus alvei]